MSIKAIQTFYNGYYFRSRLEARWAVFFDELGLEYEYEREGYEVAAGAWYLPDFKIDELWIEVKHKDDNDTNALEKMSQLVIGLQEPGVIVYGDPVDHLAVLFVPHNQTPGYVRQLANFNNLANSKEPAIKARQARFAREMSHA